MMHGKIYSVQKRASTWSKRSLYFNICMLNSSYLFMCYLVKFILIYNIAWFNDIYTNKRIALLLIPQPQHTNKYKSSLKICGYFILVLLGTKHTVKIIHTWAHVIIEPKLFFSLCHIRIVFRFIFFWLSLVLVKKYLSFRSLFFHRWVGMNHTFNCNANAHHIIYYHLLQIHFD